MAERTVVTNFEVTKSGATGAPGEIAADIQQVETAAGQAGNALEQEFLPATTAAEQGVEQLGDAAEVTGKSIYEELAQPSRDAAAAEKEMGDAASAAKPEIEAVGDAASTAGQKVAKSGDDWGVIISKVNLAVVALQSAHQVLGEAESKLNSLAKDIGLAGDEFEGLGNWTLFAERNLDTIGNAVKNFDVLLDVLNSGSFEEFNRKGAVAQAALKGLKVDLDGAGAGTDKLAAGAAAAGPAIDALGSKGTAAAAGVSKIGEAVATTASKTKQAAGEFAQSAEGIGKGTEALEKAAPAAAAAAGDLAGATKATSELGAAQGEAGAKIENTTATITSLDERVGALETKLSSLASSISASLSNGDVAGPLLAALDSVEAKVDSLIGKFATLAAGPVGGPASPAAQGAP